MHRDAAEHLGYFLREAPKDTPAARRAGAEEMYREACKRVTRIQLQVDPPDAEAILDGRSLGRGPWAAEIVLTPGRRVLELRESQDGLANAGTGLLIGGGLVAAGAATYLIVSHLRARPTAATAVRVAPAFSGKDGGGVWVTGRF